MITHFVLVVPYVARDPRHGRPYGSLTTGSPVDTDRLFLQRQEAENENLRQTDDAPKLNELNSWKQKLTEGDMIVF